VEKGEERAAVKKGRNLFLGGEKGGISSLEKGRLELLLNEGTMKGEERGGGNAEKE